MSFAQFLKGAEAGEELYLAETPVASFGTSPPQQHEMLRDLQVSFCRDRLFPTGDRIQGGQGRGGLGYGSTVQAYPYCLFFFN
jgi:hypothetical protein